jgi:hypothetical protein
MSRSPFGFVSLAVDEPKDDPAQGVQALNSLRSSTRQVLLRAAHKAARKHHFQAGAASDVVFGPVMFCTPVPSTLTV